MVTRVTFFRVNIGTTDVDAGYSGVYLDIGKKAYCNGVSHDVTINSFSATYADLRNYKLYAIQLTPMAKLGQTIGYFGYYVTFPAGSVNITYSETYGTGEGPDPVLAPEQVLDSSSNSPKTILGMSKEAFSGIIVGSVIGVAILILAIVFAYRLRRKQVSASINDANGTNGTHHNDTTDQTENTTLVPSEAQQIKYQALA